MLISHRAAERRAYRIDRVRSVEVLDDTFTARVIGQRMLSAAGAAQDSGG